MSRYLDMSQHSGDQDEVLVLPKGPYVVFLQDDPETGGVCRKEGKKADFLKLTLRILGPDQYQGYRIWSNLSLSETALWRVAQLYRAVEPREDKRNPGLNLDNDDEMHRELFYKPMIVQTSHENVNGEIYLRVERFKPIATEQEYAMWKETMEVMVGENEDYGYGPRESEEFLTPDMKEPARRQQEEPQQETPSAPQRPQARRKTTGTKKGSQPWG